MPPGGDGCAAGPASCGNSCEEPRGGCEAECIPLADGYQPVDNDPCKICSSGNLTDASIISAVSIYAEGLNVFQSFLSISDETGYPLERITGKALYQGTPNDIQWEIFPGVGEISNVMPNDMKGREIRFNAQVNHPRPYDTRRESGGSTTKSLPLSYRLKAAANTNVPNKCYSEVEEIIEQDQIDIIRQEYVNHGLLGTRQYRDRLPDRYEFFIPQTTIAGHFTASAINKDNPYQYIIGNPGGLAELVRTAYNVEVDNYSVVQLPEPTDFGLLISSAWRNLERNEYWGGAENSVHQYGHAVDIVPYYDEFGRPELHPTEINCLLVAAGESPMMSDYFVQAEIGGADADCDDNDVDHVHFNRNE